MKLSDFEYELPPHLIAQEPLPQRDRSKLMVLRQAGRSIEHRLFQDLAEMLSTGDVLVLNDTKVIPARLVGRKATGGKVELLLLNSLGDGKWEALVHPSAKLRKGACISIDQNGFGAEALDDHRPGEGLRVVRFSVNDDEELGEKIEHFGHVPIPPYIKREDAPSDRGRYQTVFAREPGAVAAPTAGLHFSQPLLEKLQAKGVSIVYVTLHVGYGTFRTVTCETLEKYVMHKERFSISPEAARAINERSGRLVACGTTSLRALESAVDRSGKIQPTKGETGLFIHPPYHFKTADLLITNFHLPRSTLLMLACAFGGYEWVMRSYEEAKQLNYRFYSYGDAMLIERSAE